MSGILVVPGSARTDERPVLFLEAGHALRVVESARRARERPVETAVRWKDSPAPPVATALSMRQLVPSRFDIRDGYAIDVHRATPRFANPVDRDEHVSIEILRRGVGLLLDVESETFPIGDGADLLRVRIERRF